jgi:tRNA modification GTPase
LLPADHDTIAAISTPPGIGGIAVLRLSGPQALSTIQPFFSAFHKIKPRLATFGKLTHPDLGEGAFDDCVVTFFEAPHSATGEDVVEISIHGGAFLQQKLLEVLYRAPGVRPASAGEFTLRAFLRGKMDLSRAEAVIDLIHAKDAAAHRNARNQLQGGLRSLVDTMSEQLVHILTLLEAELDFSDQEIDFTPADTFLPRLHTLQQTCSDLLESYFYGRRLEEGIRVPLVGAPNSGKSSIFNLLLGEERAIVTRNAGTTRDTIEKTIVVAGHSVVLVDTAGLRETADEAEAFGVGRSKDEMERADLVLLVQAPDTEDVQAFSNVDNSYITIYNKVDLDSNPPSGKSVYLSCVTKTGFSELKNILYSQVINMVSTGAGGVVLSNERHRDVFLRFYSQLTVCVSAIESKSGPEYIASDIRMALDVLGEISGKTTPDDILNQIFAGFCVGK